MYFNFFRKNEYEYQAMSFPDSLIYEMVPKEFPRYDYRHGLGCGKVIAYVFSFFHKDYFDRYHHLMGFFFLT
jgi:hypothetical protein